MPTQDELIEAIVSRQMVNNRVEGGFLNSVDEKIDGMLKSIKPIIASKEEIPNQEAASRIITEISPQLESTWGSIQNETFTNLNELKEDEAVWIINKLNEQEEEVSPRQAVGEVSATEVGGLVIAGMTLANLFERTRTQANQRISDTIREGALFNQTPAQVARGIVGGRENKKVVPGVAPKIKSYFATAIKTATVKTTNFARDVGYKIHPSIRGKMQVSIFDGKTSDICKAYGGKVWTTNNQPVNHQLPWNGGPPRHPNCRSTIVPIKDLGNIPEGFDFEKWFKKQSKEFQEEALGPSKAEMFRKGNINLTDLVNQRQRPLTIEELKRYYN